MTLQQYVESISRVFSDKGQTEIAIDVNAVLRDFCERSKILKDTLNMTADTIILDSTKSSVTPIHLHWNAVVDGGGYVSFNFPVYGTDGLEIAALWELHTYDSSGIELSDMCSWNMANDEVRIYNNVDRTTSAFPSTVTTMKFDIIKYNVPLTALGDSPSIPAEFHRAVEAKVLAGYYRRLPMPSAPNAYGAMLAMAKSMENEYEDALVKAKRLFNVNRNLGSIAGTITL